MKEKPLHNLKAVTDHRRQWRKCLYVYPVVSRRSKGLSIGVNLNPERKCTFSCLYCQIDRAAPRNLSEIRLDVLRDELEQAMEEAISGRIWQEGAFSSVPASQRRINDIAFSGDGEPTCLPNFDKAVEVAAQVRLKFKRPELQIVVITNSSQMDQPQFQRALPILDANNGCIWAKLDAGTEAFFQRVNCPARGLSLQKIVDNIVLVARRRPVIIQTLLLELEGAGPSEDEITAYCSRLKEIIARGGRISLVQLHTIARPPASMLVRSLSDDELGRIAAAIKGSVPEVPVEVYFGRRFDAPE